MNLREALIAQAPSLALQRAAADEIARLDSMVKARFTANDVVEAGKACGITGSLADTLVWELCRIIGSRT